MYLTFLAPIFSSLDVNNTFLLSDLFWWLKEFIVEIWSAVGSNRSLLASSFLSVLKRKDGSDFLCDSWEHKNHSHFIFLVSYPQFDKTRSDHLGECASSCGSVIIWATGVSPGKCSSKHLSSLGRSLGGSLLGSHVLFSDNILQILKKRNFQASHSFIKSFL